MAVIHYICQTIKAAGRLGLELGLMRVGDACCQACCWVCSAAGVRGVLGSQCFFCPLLPCASRYHSGPPKEGWSYVWPNNGTTRLVDVQNAAGFTPLHYAVWVGRKEAIQVCSVAWLLILIRMRGFVRLCCFPVVSLGFDCCAGRAGLPTGLLSICRTKCECSMTFSGAVLAGTCFL